MGQRDIIFQGAGHVISSSKGAEKQAAPKQPDETVSDEDARAPVESGSAGRGVTRITSDERDPIAAALRRVYDDAATEPLPDELSRLVSKLEASEKDG